MGFEYDATDMPIEVMALLEPNQWYPFEIKDAQQKLTTNGNQQVKCKCVVVEHPKYDGVVVYHNVTFLPKDNKGAGIAIHFLKTIGQPFEDKFHVEPSDWEGKRFMGRVTTREYEGKQYNQISSVGKIKDEFADPFAG